MARSSSSAATVKDLGATPILCSLGSVQVDDLTRHQIEAVVHAAAMAEDWGRYQDYFDANVVGTQQLLDAAKAAWCIHRFVHISSEAVHFDGADRSSSSSSSSSSSPVDYVESDPLQPKSPFPYTATKAQAETLVVAANTTDFCTVILRPRLVWGPEDSTVAPTVRRILKDGGFWWVNHGAAVTSVCHIDNLVHAILLCLDASTSTSIGGQLEKIGGEAFFIADDQLTTQKEFLTAYMRATYDLALPNRSLPYWLLMPVSWCLTTIWNWIGQPAAYMPPLTPMALYVVSQPITVNTKKAKQVLGWEPLMKDQGRGMQLLTEFSAKTTKKNKKAQ
eukprot:CAMPEP_0113469722 /NCGR_PEP_ID=MMETSP0014_2-20120614/16052_1 /TAXON_ID=2857 /ORGANISM="Nitzschia sp." /LENGTH=333 /DNA_ID=CAMNT_0000362221 /DNA_START=147 /DNA_END=1148 /DNA_ORIENTATION=- /assembly_acc=CAM_ASM_000159